MYLGDGLGEYFCLMKWLRDWSEVASLKPVLNGGVVFVRALSYQVLHDLKGKTIFSYITVLLKLAGKLNLKIEGLALMLKLY